MPEEALELKKNLRCDMKARRNALTDEEKKHAAANCLSKLKELPDKYEQSYEGYKKALTACGIHMLENASETVRLDEAPVRISGLEIPLRAYARFGKKDLPLKEITDRIGEHGEE